MEQSGFPVPKMTESSPPDDNHGNFNNHYLEEELFKEIFGNSQNTDVDNTQTFNLTNFNNSPLQLPIFDEIEGQKQSPEINQKFIFSLLVDQAIDEFTNQNTSEKSFISVFFRERSI